MSWFFETWPLIARGIGAIIREALIHGEPRPVTIEVVDADTPRLWLRRVEHRDERGWVTVDVNDDDVLYDAGDLFDAAFTAVVGRPPSTHRRQIPEFSFDVLLVRGAA